MRVRRSRRWGGIQTASKVLPPTQDPQDPLRDCKLVFPTASLEWARLFMVGSALAHRMMALTRWMVGRTALTT